MRKICSLLICVSGILMSCDSNSKIAPDNKTAIKSVSNTEAIKCYAYTTNKDSIFLKVKQVGNIVTGELVYIFFEKDRNDGIIEGSVKGDTLIAEYKFSSEGSESYREVVFIKKGEDLVEGHGDMEERNEKLVFKSKTDLDFTSEMILKRKDCK